MKRLKNITILLCFLSLLAFISCSAEDKTGVANNPPEDTEIVDGETGSGGTGSGSSSGGSSGTETDGGSGEGGSEEGEGGTETPPTPSEPETPPSETEIATIEAKDFPTDLLGYYTHSKTGYTYTEVKSIMNEGVKTTQILATFDNGTVEGARHSILIEKWKKTTKGGKIIKLEGERDKGHGCYTVTFDYETKTISGTFKHTGVDWSFSGTKN